MTSERQTNDRVEGRRYRIDVDPNGKRWWEVVWVRELDSYLAEHWHIIKPAGAAGDAELTVSVGTDPSYPLLTAAQLSAEIDAEIPPAVAQELEADRAAYPFVDHDDERAV